MPRRRLPCRGSGETDSATASERIRGGELEDPMVLNDDLIVVKRTKSRVFLKDSILRDLIDTVNPFR